LFLAVRPILGHSSNKDAAEGLSTREWISCIPGMQRLSEQKLKPWLQCKTQKHSAAKRFANVLLFIYLERSFIN